MSAFKYLIYILVLIAMTACKTSPTPEEGSDLSSSDTANDQLLTNLNSEADTSGSESAAIEAAPVAASVVNSSADTDSSLSANISTYIGAAGEFSVYARETNGWDESGWSIITPSEDSRLIYVSSSMGDDQTAEYYAPRDITDLDDPGLIKPYKTIEAANANTREGFPDWLILRQGDAWEVNELIRLKKGRSVAERSVVTSYGLTGVRPIIKSDANEIFRIWSNRSYLAVSGIAFYAHKRDPESGDFSGWGQTSETTAIRMYSPKGTSMGSILLEGNDFNYFSKGISINGGGDVFDVVIRRNTIRNAYSESAHSQGIYAEHTSALLEENVFDHNGWYKKQVDTGNEKSEGQANMFNHNTYFAKSFGSKFLGNIFLRSSSIQNKWTASSDSDAGIDSIRSSDLWMEDNVYVGGEIGISAGGNTDFNTGPRWKNITIINNVMLAIGRDQPTNRTLGWNIEATDWDGGLICGNYVLHTDNPLITNVLGIRLKGHSSGVIISENTIHGLITPTPGSKTGAITVDSAPKENITISDNNLQLTESSMRVIAADRLDAILFQGNKYFSDANSSEWFRSDGVSYGIESWRSVSGDVNSTVALDSFLEPRRTFESYLLSIGLTTSIDGFSQLAANQSKTNWSVDFTAQSVLNYIREGYGNTKCSR